MELTRGSSIQWCCFLERYGTTGRPTTKLWRAPVRLMSRSRPTWGHQSFDEAEVTAGDLDDRVDQFTVGM